MTPEEFLLKLHIGPFDKHVIVDLYNYMISDTMTHGTTYRQYLVQILNKNFAYFRFVDSESGSTRMEYNAISVMTLWMILEIAIIGCPLAMSVYRRYRRSRQSRALWYAIENRDFLLVKQLLRKRVNLEITNIDGVIVNPPLIYACIHGFFPIVNLLIQAGAKIDSCDSSGWTPLHHAARRGWQSIAGLLLDNGANVHDKITGVTSLWLAVNYHHIHVMKVLLDHGANVDDVMQDWLWIRPCTPRVMVEVLLHQDVKILEMVDRYGLTILQSASYAGNLGIVEILLGHGAKIDVMKYDGQTALTMAITWGHVQIVEILLRHGASVVHGHDLLDIALNKGHTEIVGMLRSRIHQYNESLTRMALVNQPHLGDLIPSIVSFL